MKKTRGHSGFKMKNSRFYQTWTQIIGSISEMVLFFSGFFLGKEMFVAALILVFLRVVSKFTISELMYRRMKAVVREENNGGI